jgi:hypothetical protein
MKSFASIFLATTISALMMGCSVDKKAPTLQNFKAPVQAYLDAKYPKCPLLVTLPYTHQAFGGARVFFLDSLAEAGLVTKTMVDNPNKGGIIGGDAKIPRYEITEEGRKHYKEKANTFETIGNQSGGFCYGKATLKSVDRFTEPVEFMGSKIVQVFYSYEVSDIPNWVSKEVFTKSDPLIVMEIDSAKKPVQRRANLVLTNDGWIQESVLNRKP